MRFSVNFILRGLFLIAVCAHCFCAVSCAPGEERGDGNTDEDLSENETDENGAESPDDQSEREAAGPALKTNVYADSLTSVKYGSGAGFGQDKLPNVVLGAPKLEGDYKGSTDVLSLGNGGEIVLEFSSGCVVDKEGDDFVVYENSFYVNGYADSPYIEAGVVSASEDGETWRVFPYRYDADAAKAADKFVGMAGKNPYGDSFDLAAAGLAKARFIKITDAGKGENALRDEFGAFIDDAGNMSPCADMCGFDLDAVGAINFSADCR